MSSLVERDYTACRRRHQAGAWHAIFSPQLMGGNPQSGQRRASTPALNGSVTFMRKELKMTTKPSSPALNHRRVAREMLELALRGTVTASLLAALAMGLIAFVVS